MAICLIENKIFKLNECLCEYLNLNFFKFKFSILIFNNHQIAIMIADIVLDKSMQLQDIKFFNHKLNISINNFISILNTYEKILEINDEFILKMINDINYTEIEKYLINKINLKQVIFFYLSNFNNYLKKLFKTF